MVNFSPKKCSVAACAALLISSAPAFAGSSGPELPVFSAAVLTESPAAAQENLFMAAPSGQVLASDPNVLLVDIREPEEWRQTGVIEGALLVSYRDADSFLATVGPLLQDGQSIALICRSGNRTSRAARQIAAIADVPVIDIAGGMLRVLAEGYMSVAPTSAQGCMVC